MTYSVEIFEVLLAIEMRPGDLLLLCIFVFGVLSLN
jgi:hypothetical protein